MVRVGHGGPLQSQTPKPHQAVISAYIPVSDLGSVCCELEVDTVLVNERKSYVSSLNLQPQLEAAVVALSHHRGGEGAWIYGLRLCGDPGLMCR